MPDRLPSVSWVTPQHPVEYLEHRAASESSARALLDSLDGHLA